MIPHLKSLIAIGAIAGSIVCPVCESGAINSARAQTVPPASVQLADTGTVRLHISGMTCGTCPTTARLALKRVRGVYSATVTLADSLGVVQYDRARVSATQVAAELTKRTGYGATILQDTSKRAASSRG